MFNPHILGARALTSPKVQPLLAIQGKASMGRQVTILLLTF